MSPEGKALVDLTLVVASILIPLGLWTHLKIEKRDITVGVVLGVIVLGMIPVLNIIALIILIAFCLTKIHKKVLIKAKD
jgi:uncharacterized membrane protein